MLHKDTIKALEEIAAGDQYRFHKAYHLYQTAFDECPTVNTQKDGGDYTHKDYRTAAISYAKAKLREE